MKSSLTLSALAVATALAAAYPAYSADPAATAANRRVIDFGGPVDWAAQDSYWQQQYPSRPYYSTERTYENYQPAYRYGSDIYRKNPGVNYDQLDQAQLRRDWENARGSSTLNWEDANQAARDAYTHLYEHRNQSGTN